MSTDTVTLPKTGTYAIDPAHTEVGFIARHLIGTKVRGRFTDVSGTFTVAETHRELLAGGHRRRRPASTPARTSGTSTCGPTTSSTSPTTRP